MVTKEEWSELRYRLDRGAFEWDGCGGDCDSSVGSGCIARDLRVALDTIDAEERDHNDTKTRLGDAYRALERAKGEADELRAKVERLTAALGGISLSCSNPALRIHGDRCSYCGWCLAAAALADVKGGA